eukprot:13049759-Alexandrium_andersonii.AAC.1
MTDAEWHDQLAGGALPEVRLDPQLSQARDWETQTQSSRASRDRGWKGEPGAGKGGWKGGVDGDPAWG